MQPQTTRTTVRARRSPPLRMAATAVALSCMAVFAPAAAGQEVQSFEGKVKLQGAPIAMSCPVSFPMACFNQSEGNSATAVMRFNRRFDSIESVCFTFHFVDDLIDPGERGDWLQFNVTGHDGFGFAPTSGPSLAERTSCLIYYHVEQLAAFEDGKQTVEINMVLGSATLESVEVHLTGVATRGI